MKKNTELIEKTMELSYKLFSEMQKQNVDRELSQTALAVAKDIHEIKKEYMLILRGISEAMEVCLCQIFLQLWRQRSNRRQQKKGRS